MSSTDPEVDNTLPDPDDQPHADTQPVPDQPYVDIAPPGDQPHPDHTLPGDLPHAEHPIVLPPDVPETEPPPEQPPVDPGTEPPAAEEEELAFFQRVTLGFNWNAISVGTEGEQVGIDAWTPTDPDDFDGEGSWRNVRTVPNSGSSSVTYPSDFAGPVRIRVRGSAASVSGDFTVT